MDMVKKNLVSIICGVIALVAIVAVFWPISGYYSELQTKADSRKNVYQSLKQIAERSRTKPITSLGTTEAEKLDRFPTEQVIAKGREVMDKVKAEAAEVYKKAVEMNIHAPLVPGALPDGKPIQAGAFRMAYNRVLDYLSDENRAQSLPVRVMNAGMPPTDAQIQIERQKAEQEIRKKLAVNAAGQAINQQQVDQELATELPKIADEMKMNAAKTCHVYIGMPPNAGLHVNQTIAQAPPGSPPDPSVIFNAQVGLWIQLDVAQAIAAANKGSKNVMESAVKQLVKIEVPDDYFKPTQMSANPDPNAMPQAANADPSAPITHNFSVSPTGRSSNGVYDVVPFNLSLDVDAARIPNVLQELSRNRFITVRRLNVSTVDSGLKQSTGYFYGDKPVVNLEMECEILLLRKWTTPLMPIGIQRTLGIAPATPTVQ